MTKAEFLDALRAKLAGLPPEELNERLAFYNEMITDRMEDGIPEEEAVAELGTVEDVVNQIMSEIPLSTLVRQKVRPRRALKVWEIILLVLGSPIWLSLLIALLAVVFSVYVSIWAVVVSLWAVEISLIASAFACAAAGILCLFRGSFWQGVAVFGAGCVCAGLAIILYSLCKSVSKGCWTIGKKMTRGIKNLFLRKENKE